MGIVNVDTLRGGSLMKCYAGIMLSITSTMAAKIWNKRNFPFDWSYDEKEYEIIEGDIMRKKPEIRDGIMTHENLVARTRLWPNGVVPYILDDGFSSVTVKEIDKSMRDIESKTCIKFIKGVR